MRHDVIYRRDFDGTPVVGVKLTNRNARAWLDRADYDTLLNRLGHVPWFAHSTRLHEYVSVSPAPKCGPITVARLIARPDPGTIVRHRDCDRMNLRRSNLAVARGSHLDAAHALRLTKTG